MNEIPLNSLWPTNFMRAFTIYIVTETGEEKTTLVIAEELETAMDMAKGKFPNSKIKEVNNLNCYDYIITK